MNSGDNGSNNNSDHQYDKMNSKDGSNGSFSIQQLQMERENGKNNNDTDSVLENNNRDNNTTTNHHKRRNHTIRENSRIQQSHRRLKFLKGSTFSLIVLFLASIWIYSFVLLSKSRGNNDNHYDDRIFNLQFEMNANKIVTTSVGRTSKIVDSLYSLCLSLSTLEKSTNNKTWPYFTMPNFDIIAAENRKQTGSLLLAYSPLVTTTNKILWEKYSIANQGWLQEKQIPKDYRSTSIIPTEIYNDIGRSILITSTNDTSYFSPLWQMSPKPENPSIINFNLLSRDKFRKLVEYTMETGQPAVSEPFDTMGELFGTSATYAKDHPQSIVVQPVFDRENKKRNNHGIIGHLIAVVPWDAYFNNIFQSRYEQKQQRQTTTIAIDTAASSKNDQAIVALHIVVHGTCSGSNVRAGSSSDHIFTYMINGPNAIFLGPGDYHNNKYDDIVVQSPFLQVSNQTNDKTCSYTFYVYPAEEMYNHYFSTYTDNYSSPTMYNVYIISVLVLVATVSILFLIHDYVSRRQQQHAKSKVHMNNNRSRNKNDSQIINSSGTLLRENSFSMLFGENIDNIMQNDPISNHNPIMFDKFDDDLQYIFDSKPKADLFLNSTVLFADIAGFTAWSSVREPTQVFTLLETVYSAFDRIAIDADVLKVETIGDCYVAVVGIPKPRNDHAIIMAQFAQNCKNRFNKLTRILEVTLGPETGELAMKFGVHSGPVTAGVLRGPKRSRFQLFGDTVNTASQLENTGKRDRIHLSQQTAELLIASGKAHWVRARKEQIIAKGKGSIPTFWLVEGANYSEKYNDSSDHINNNNNTVSPYNNGENGVGGASNTLANRDKDLDNPVHNPLQGERRTEPLHESGHTLGGDSIHVEITEENLRIAEEASASDLDFPASRKNNGLPGLLLSPIKNDKNNTNGIADKMTRLVDWNCEVLSKLLKQIVARRNCTKRGSNSSMKRGSNSSQHRSLDAVMKAETNIMESGKCVRNEIVEVITLPRFDGKAAKKQMDPRSVDLGDDVESQLRDYVGLIASMYRPNPFHNFEHASHVTMSTIKLLSRIIAPTGTSAASTALADLRRGSLNYRRASNERASSTSLANIRRGSNDSGFKKKVSAKLHDHTYGITSDPLTQFAVVFSALIHDVDHRGVPNFLLVRDDEELANMYNNLSIAEQNSVDLAWDALMDPKFEDLRNCIYADEIELNRFRQLIVNSIMATDIFDKELSQLRKNRWDKAFHIHNATKSDENTIITTTINNSTDAGGGGGNENANESGMDVDRKATIVIEHLIQASDVVHTMQHWQVYIKWNQRLFEEMMVAYQTGRSNNNPTAGWYKGELGFFDNYVIPLAKKLKECGVFGVSSDEYLNYAIENRQEWEMKGQDIVKRYTKKYQRYYRNHTL